MDLRWDVCRECLQGDMAQAKKLMVSVMLPILPIAASSDEMKSLVNLVGKTVDMQSKKSLAWLERHKDERWKNPTSKNNHVKSRRVRDLCFGCPYKLEHEVLEQKNVE